MLQLELWQHEQNSQLPARPGSDDHMWPMMQDRGPQGVPGLVQNAKSLFGWYRKAACTSIEGHFLLTTEGYTYQKSKLLRVSQSWLCKLRFSRTIVTSFKFRILLGRLAAVQTPLPTLPRPGPPRQPEFSQPSGRMSCYQLLVTVCCSQQF